MNFSIKNKLFRYSILIILILINVSCKKDKIKVVVNNQEKVVNGYKVIDSCLFFENKISINEDVKESEKIIVKINSEFSTKEITLNELNFRIQNISEVDINCNENNKFHIIFNENIGNNNYSTYHLFELESTSNKYIWSKVYKVENNRQGTSIVGVNLKEKIKFKNYNAQEPNNLTFLTIYSFTGFQEEKEPVIDDFYNEIESFSKKTNKKIELFGDEIVINYLTRNIEINNKNLSKYNDIAFYLEQSKLYNESIFLLEIIIQKSPNRTVAYINLGDAYWGLNKKGKAKKAYKTYIEQMKEKGKENKIPKQVYSKLNS